MPVPGEVMVGGGAGRRLRVLSVLTACLAAAGLAAGLLLGGRDPSTVRDGGAPSSARQVAAGDPVAVAEAFLDAWAAEDWDTLQALTADASLDVAGAHELAHATLGVSTTRLTAGEPTVTGERVRVPFDGVWTLSGLGEHRFGSTLTLAPTEHGWRVRWWYPTLHPDMAPGRRFERVRVFPERAPILGPDGTPLVATEQRVVVALEPRRMTSGPDAVLDALAGVGGAEEPRIRRLLGRADLEPAGRYPLLELSPRAFAAERDRLRLVPGLVFETRTVRVPGRLGALEQVLGGIGEVTAEILAELGAPYRPGDTVGRSGVERAYERRLAGVPEQEARIVEGDALVATLRYAEGSEPEPVTVTLDAALQERAAGVLRGLDRPAALVAVDTSTGEVRAAASHPADGFDRALRGRYPPGSTFKVVTAVAALASGRQPDGPVPCPPVVRIGGRELRNAGGDGPGVITLTEALTRSCNTAFALLGRELGAAELERAASLLGFGARYDPGLPAFGAAFPDPADAAELAASAIGQGRVEVSPLHMASVAAAASSGVWRPPRLVRVDGERGRALERRLPAGTVEPLRAMLRAVVTSGTGSAAALPGAPVSGKTGSAQFGDGSRTHAWFVGYRGDLAVAVVVEGGGGGGSVAAPLAAAFWAGVGGPEAGGSPSG